MKKYIFLLFLLNVSNIFPLKYTKRANLKEANLKLSEIEYTNNNGIIEIKSEDIITQIGWTKREEYKYNYLLGIFEGANVQSCSDAVPIVMLRAQGGLNEVNYIDVNILDTYHQIKIIQIFPQLKYMASYQVN